jgi:hypothetical protein
MIDGIKVTLGEKEFVAAPLSLKSLRMLNPKMRKLAGLQEGTLPDGEQFGVISEIVFESLHRNHPELTQDDVDGMLDMRNTLPILTAVTKVSGLGVAQLGEVKGS